MKKLLSIILAAIMLVACCVPAFAEDAVTLKFDKDGDFKILHITDCQDTYPANTTMLQFIQHCLDKYAPDLVVLGGDNTVPKANDIEASIKELTEVFVKNETYFTLVFGNHDREDNRGGNDKLLAFYQKHGGKYCLTYDQWVDTETESMKKRAGTHNLPIMSSDGKKVAYNLYMFDSGTSIPGAGYECVNADQVKWFKDLNSEYTKNNGGNVIPSMVFQHIIVGEIMDVFYKEKKDVVLSLDSKYCNKKEYDLTIADFSAIKDGMLLEPPCPGDDNFGQFDAMVEQGTVAVFSGHDHVNTFTVNHKGVDIVNTAGCTFHSYGQDYNRGGRLITIHEDTKEYESETLLLAEEALDSDVIELNFFSKIFGVMINKIILAFFNLF